MTETSFTPGPWRAIAQGGSSTVVAAHAPKRNDSRIPSYGAERDYCIAYPFLDDDGTARRDFVCFAHDDARLIAAAPDLYDALRELDALPVKELSAGVDSVMRPVSYMAYSACDVQRIVRAALVKAHVGAGSTPARLDEDSAQ